MLATKTHVLRAAALLATLFALPCLANDGTPDPGFGTAGAAFITPDNVEATQLRPYAAITLPDGKILVAGERNKVIPNNPTEPNRRAMLARFNADGSADASFGDIPAMPGVRVLPDLVPGTGAAIQSVEALQRLADGSIIVAGTTSVRAPTKGFVAKLSAGGDLDASFGTGGITLLPAIYLHALAIDSQGRIVVAGEKWIGVIPHSVVVRFDASGHADTSFGSSGDGTAPINWDGVAGQAGYLSTLGLNSDDGILVGGSYDVYGPGMGSDFAIARLTASGALDTTFAGTGWRVFHRNNIAPSTNNNGIDRLLPSSDGGAVFAGHYYDDNTGTNIVLGRIDGGGDIDTSFGATVTSPGYLPVEVEADAYDRYPTGLARQADGKLVVSARFASPNKSTFLAFRASADGAELDTSFANAGLMTADLAPDGIMSEASTVVLDADERPILAGFGQRSTTSSLTDIAVLRLSHDNAPTDRIFASGFDG